MKPGIYALVLLLCIFYFGCESSNIEEKYYQNPIDTTSNVPTIVKPRGEIAWFPLNGNLNDSTKNATSLILVGEANYVDGMNKESGKGLYLDGASYLLINLGYYDTLSIVFWIKGSGELDELNEPVLFDYGFNSLSAQLDGSSGATSLNVNKNGNIASSKDAPLEYLNSFNKYSFLYVEAGGDITRVYFKGYTSTGAEIIYKEDLNFPGIISSQSEILYIGRSSQRENQNHTYFRGAIDEIHIYSQPLTDLEMESLAFTQTE